MSYSVFHRYIQPTSVATLAEASALVTAARDRSGMGSSNWPAADVYAENGDVFHVGYNGRVWAGPAGTWEPGVEPAYCPFAAERVAA